MQTSTPATIKYTVGVPGAGKSYTRTRWIVDDFLQNESGILFTNVPLNVTEICRFLETKGFDPELIAERIHIIPSKELTLWKTTFRDTGLPAINEDYVEPSDDSIYEEDLSYSETQYKHVGPWLYFQQFNLANSHILIDEIQELVNIRSSRKLKTEWGTWLSTIRHESCTFEAMTQDDLQVPSEIKNKAETKLEIRPNKSQRFPLLPVLNYDYYQLGKGLFNTDWTSSTVYEYGVSAGGKKEITNKKKYRFEPEYFKFYNSYSKTSNSKSSKKKEEFERFSKLQLISWFIKRNYTSVGLLCCYAVAAVFLYNGGFSKLITHFTSMNNGNKDAYYAKEEGLSLEEYKEKKLIEKITKQLEEKREISKPVQSTEVRKSSNKVAKKPAPIQVVQSDKIVFIGEGKAITRSGQSLFVDSVVEKGKYKGKKVKEIDYRDRSVLLVTGEKIRLE